MIYIPLILVAVTFVVCGADDGALKKLVAGNLEFTANAYKKEIETVQGNLLICGISAKTIISLLSQGAEGETRTELQHSISEGNDSVKAYKQLIPYLNQNNDNLSLRSANRIYAADGFKIRDSFKQISEDPYMAGIQNVNFGKSTETAGIINNWVANQTNNKINNLISPNQLNSNTRLVLVNTLYFNGKWISPFKKYLTRKAPFYTSANDSKEIDMMHNAGTYSYRRCNQYKAQFLEIPFKQSNISMHFVLPENKQGLADLEPHIKDILVPHSMHPKTVAVSIPKFYTKSNIDFKAILKSLGVEKVFSYQQSNLTGISADKSSNSNCIPKERLVVDFITQQTVVNVTESGVVAAAATAVGVSTTAVIEPTIQFNADHPFLYYIRENDLGLILFVGKFLG